MVASSLSQVPTSFSAVRSSAVSLTARSESSRLVDSMVRTMSLSQRAMVRTMVSCVTRSPRSAAPKKASMGVTSLCLYIATARVTRVAQGQAELLVREALQPFVLLELVAHRLEPARRAGVPGHGGADLRVKTGDLGRDGSGLVAVLLELPGPRPGWRRCECKEGRERAESEQGDRSQTTYRMALFQCASLEAGGGCRLSRSSRPVSGPGRKGRVET